MKKDIIIPVVENVFLAAVLEWSDDFMDKVWYVYIINDSDFVLHNVMIVSKASGNIDGEFKKTSSLRHSFLEMKPISFNKIELIDENVLALDNEFMVTFFKDDVLFDKKFIFKANSIVKENMTEVPLLFIDGVIVE